MGLFDNANNIISQFGGKVGRPPLEGLYSYALAAFAGFTISDLAINAYRPDMLPSQKPPAKPTKQIRQAQNTLLDYQVISKRNIFNEDGKIPDRLSSGDDQKGPITGEAVPSKLPLKLLGTIVHFNPEMSIATINMSNRNKTAAYKVGEEIPKNPPGSGIAEVTAITRRKVTFINKQLQRLEYIDIPADLKLNFGFSKPTAKPGGDGEVRKTGEFDFSIKRDDVDKYVKDLSGILRQARMVPITGAGGGVDGFRFASIQPGSIFEKLGFKVGDAIKSVNGEPVNSPTKAMEMYNALKSENTLNLGVERDGREEEFNYTIE